MMNRVVVFGCFVLLIMFTVLFGSVLNAIDNNIIVSQRGTRNQQTGEMEYFLLLNNGRTVQVPYIDYVVFDTWCVYPGWYHALTNAEVYLLSDDSLVNTSQSLDG